VVAYSGIALLEVHDWEAENDEQKNYGNDFDDNNVESLPYDLNFLCLNYWIVTA